MPAGDRAVSASESACGQGRLSASESACWQGLRTGAHLRCFPSHRCAVGPSPFTKPRAATPSEVPAHPAFPGRGTMLQPLGCRDYSGFDLCAASIRKSGPEIKNRCTVCPRFNFFAASIRKSWAEFENRCTDCPCFDLLAASILKSGLEIGNQCKDCPCFDLFAASIANSGPEIRNHCSAIVPASRIARLRRRCRNGAASDSNFLRRKVLQFRLQQSLRQRRMARLQHS